MMANLFAMRSFKTVSKFICIFKLIYVGIFGYYKLKDFKVLTKKKNNNKIEEDL